MAKIHILTREFTTKDIPNVASGMTDKYWNARRALDINITSEIDNIQGGVILVDPLWARELPNTNERIEKLKAHAGIKIAWCEEQELLRWNNAQRLEFIQICDKITVCNKFLQKIFAEFDIDADILYTPIDEGFWTPASEKKPVVVATGKVCVEKGVERIIELFKQTACTKIYMGHAGLWGGEKQDTDVALERELAKYCHWIPFANRNEVREHLFNTIFTGHGFTTQTGESSKTKNHKITPNPKSQNHSQSKRFSRIHGTR